MQFIDEKKFKYNHPIISVTGDINMLFVGNNIIIIIQS